MLATKETEMSYLSIMLRGGVFPRVRTTALRKSRTRTQKTHSNAEHTVLNLSPLRAGSKSVMKDTALIGLFEAKGVRLNAKLVAEGSTGARGFQEGMFITRASVARLSCVEATEYTCM